MHGCWSVRIHQSDDTLGVYIRYIYLFFFIFFISIDYTHHDGAWGEENEKNVVKEEARQKQDGWLEVLEGDGRLCGDGRIDG